MNFNTASRSKTTLASHLRGALALSLIVTAGAAAATDYYVSPSGDDANAGTLLSPFRTVSKGVSLAQPGDAVIVRGGTYRETVTVPRSGTAGAPIRIEAFSGETPVIDGTDVVTGWGGSNSAWSVTSPSTLSEGHEQVFVDGRPQTEARWPNSTGNLSRPVFAASASQTNTPSGTGTQITINDPNLTQPAGFWAGSKVNVLVGLENCAQTGRVVSNAPGTITFVTDLPVDRRLDSNPLRYYIYGTSAARDEAGEWNRSGDTVVLKPAFGDAASNHTIAVKRRPYGIDLGTNSYVSVSGLSFFACAITSRSTNTVKPTNNTVSGIYSIYGGHDQYIVNEWTDGDPAVFLAGNNHRVSNSVVAYTSASGITIKGDDGLIQNNQVHDADYAANNYGGITVEGNRHAITDNTIYSVGRFGVSVYDTKALTILRNEIYNFGIQTNDLGAIYTWNNDGAGTEIAYNVTHDATTGGAGSNGILLDDGCSNYLLHHNIVYNTDIGIHANPTATNITIAHNTVSVRNFGFFLWMTWSAYSNVKVANNLSNGGMDLIQNITGITTSGHLSPNQDPKFVNGTNHDYRLSAGSPAIDLGGILSGLSGIVHGLLPDAGAVEYGEAMFAYGMDAATAPATPPVDITATAGLRRINLAWTPRNGDASYNVYRSSAKGYGYTLLASNVTATSFVDDTATPDAPQYYVVTGVNANGESGWSNEVSNIAYSQIKVQGLMGEFYSGIDAGNSWNGVLFSTPVLRRIDQNLDYNWGQGSPDPRLPVDNFSAIWTGTVTAPTTGTYTFTCQADNNSRLVVNGKTLVDNFYGANNVTSGTIDLVAGQAYSIRVEYYEITNSAQIHLLWSYPGQTDAIAVPRTALSPADGNGMEGNYFNDVVGANPADLNAHAKNWVNNRLDGALSFSYPGSPMTAVNATYWSATWNGQLLAPVDGTYTFRIDNDDAASFAINGNTILTWSTGSGRTATVALKAGELYNLHVRYANATSGGSMNVSWAFPGQPMQSIPGRFLYVPLVSNYWGYGAQYYSDGAFQNLVATRVDTAINYDWTGKSPVSGLGTSGYSVRWSGRITSQVEGNVKFQLDGVGNAKLIVNGKPWIANTTGAAFNITASNALYMRKGVWYGITVEYAPGTNPGKIHLRKIQNGVTSEIALSDLRTVWTNK